MARKAYSDEERAQVKEALMVTMIRCIADRGLIHSSIDVLCGKVGISKTFFYSFFSSKEELVLHALRYQQPRLLDYARQLMEDPALSWRAGVETFLKNCCYGAESGVAVLSIEEEQQARRCLSEENFQAFRQDQVSFYGKLLSIFGLPVDSIDPRLFGNLALSMMMVHKAIPDTSAIASLPVGGASESAPVSIDYYGADVFSTEVMKKYLPKDMSLIHIFPPSWPLPTTISAWAFTTPAATAPMPTSETSLTETRASGLELRRS